MESTNKLKNLDYFRVFRSKSDLEWKCNNNDIFSFMATSASARSASQPPKAAAAQLGSGSFSQLSSSSAHHFQIVYRRVSSHCKLWSQIFHIDLTIVIKEESVKFGSNWGKELPHQVLFAVQCSGTRIVTIFKHFSSENGGTDIWSYCF